MDTAYLQILLGAALFAILFSIGIGLQVRDFRRVLARPRAFGLILACQLLLLPAFAIGLARLLDLSDAVAFGLLLLAVCPGGVTSNLFTRLAGGAAALSVSLTAVNSMLAALSIPAVLYIGQLMLGSRAQLVTIPVDFLFQQLLLITFLPVVLGMGVRHFAPAASERIERVLFPLTAFLFFALILSVWVSEFENYRRAFVEAGVPTVLLFAGTVAVSLLIARSAGLERQERVAMVFEVGVQNPPVAFFIAVNVLEDMALMPPSAVYAVVMVLGSLVMVGLLRRRTLIS